MRSEKLLFKRCGAIVLMLAALSLVNACSWAGETAGRAKAGVENAIDNTKEGYQKGYEEGKKD